VNFATTKISSKTYKLAQRYLKLKFGSWDKRQAPIFANKIAYSLKNLPLKFHAVWKMNMLIILTNVHTTILCRLHDYYRHSRNSQYEIRKKLYISFYTESSQNRCFLEQWEVSYHGIFHPRPEPSCKRLRFLRETESPCSLLPTCFTKHSCDPFVDRG